MMEALSKGDHIVDEVNATLCGQVVSRDVWSTGYLKQNGPPPDRRLCQACIKIFEWKWPTGMESIDHPSHYNVGKIECIEFIEDQKLGFNLGNAIKYVVRAGKKTPNITEDLRKAVWYLRREIELVTAKCEEREPARPNAMNPRRGVE